MIASLTTGCGGRDYAHPHEVCDWMEDCFGGFQGCDKAMVDQYQQAADQGCSAEIGEMFSCAIEQECGTDGSECTDENDAYSECIGLF